MRVIAATHRDIDAAVESERFRADLRYRLDVVRIVIPPLRERAEDIVPLAESFLAHYNREFGRDVTGLTPSAESALLNYDWPGNVRELRNVMERAMLFSPGRSISAEDLIIETQYTPGQSKRGGATRFKIPPEGISLEEVEKDFVRQAMRHTGGNRARPRSCWRFRAISSVTGSKKWAWLPPRKTRGQEPRVEDRDEDSQTR